MCHTDVPPHERTPVVDRRETAIPLSTGEAMPVLDVGEPSDPPVLLIPDLFGRSAFYEHLAALLAASAFRVVLPEFFFRQGPLDDATRPAAFARRARLDEMRSLEDLRDAVRWLRGSQPDARVGVVGFCMGGTFALDLASTESRVVTAAFYGFPVHPEAVVSPPPAPMSLVASLRGPVLAFWGEEDETVGIDHVRRYVDAATAANPAFECEILPGLGHGFLASAGLSDPDDAAAATWQRTVSHLSRYLRAPSN
jgi:dienelactone hydrolase